MKKTLATQMLALLAVFGTTCSVSLADDSKAVKTETQVESTLPKITREEIKTKLAKLTLVDALNSKLYDRSRIKGSINLPKDFADTQAAKLLPDKNAEIVVYCMNTKCHASDKVADHLAKIGYKNVHIYREGLQDWISAKLPTEGSNPTEPMPADKTASGK